MNGLRYLIERLVDLIHRILFRLLSPFYAVRQWIDDWIARVRNDAEFAYNRPARPWWMTILFSPVLFPLWVFRKAIPWFFFVLFHPANRKRLLLGIPAIFVASLALLMLTLSFIYPKERLVRRYETAGYQSFNEGDLAQAQIYYEKLCYLEPTEDRYRFLLARVREESREWNGAYGIMAGLAPLNEYGFGPAHLWMAQQLVYRPQLILSLDRRLTPEDRPRLVRYHLEGALESNPADPIALTLKATVLQAEDPEQALAIFRQLVPLQPKILLTVARLEKQLGRDAKSHDAIDQYQALLEELLQKRPIPVRVYVDLITCHTMKREFREAIAFADRFSRDVRPSVARELKARVLVAWAREQYESDAKDRLTQSLMKLTQALRYEPELPEAYALLEDVVQGNAQQRVEIREACESLVAEGINSGMMQVILGSLLLSEGEFERAELALRLALKLDSQAGPALNNLAWLYSNQEEPDYEHALELIGQAISLQPDRGRYYFTRGKILYKQKDYASAIVDFEVAHQSLPDNLNLLAFCARTHEALGNLTQAESYQARFEQLRNADSETTQTPSEGSDEPEGASTKASGVGADDVD